eukprot:gene16438-1962_t
MVNVSSQGAINGAWHRSGVPRGELFITSKVSGNSDQAYSTIQRDISEIGTSYID